MERRERKVRLKPLRRADAVVTVVEVRHHHEEVPQRWTSDTGDVLGCRKCYGRWVVEDPISRTSINNEANCLTLVLRNPKYTVHAAGLGCEVITDRSIRWTSNRYSVWFA